MSSYQHLRFKADSHNNKNMTRLPQIAITFCFFFYIVNNTNLTIIFFVEVSLNWILLGLTQMLSYKKVNKSEFIF